MTVAHRRLAGRVAWVGRSVLLIGGSFGRGTRRKGVAGVVVDDPLAPHVLDAALEAHRFPVILRVVRGGHVEDQCALVAHSPFSRRTVLARDDLSVVWACDQHDVLRGQVSGRPGLQAEAALQLTAYEY